VTRRLKEESVDAGLCERCTHGRRVESKRGSTFWMCARSQTDASFRKYPQLPVVDCRGFEELSPETREP
jgi:hypothetical protein